MKKLSRLISVLLILSLLCSSLISCNKKTGDKESSESNGESNSGESNSGESNSGESNSNTNSSLPPYGSAIGNRCIPTDLSLVSGDGTVNIKDYIGKVVVINFWGTWCGPCKSELPHFNEVAEEYSDSVVIITVHSNYYIQNAPQYVASNYSDSKMIFAKDDSSESYYSVLNPGKGAYPITMVLDKDGVITYKVVGAISKSTLISEIEKAK